MTLARRERGSRATGGNQAAHNQQCGVCAMASSCGRTARAARIALGIRNRAHIGRTRFARLRRGSIGHQCGRAGKIVRGRRHRRRLPGATADIGAVGPFRHMHQPLLLGNGRNIRMALFGLMQVRRHDIVAFFVTMLVSNHN